MQITQLASDTYRARARARNDAGNLHQLRAVAGLTAADTIADVSVAWLETGSGQGSIWRRDIFDLRIV
ncbi:hypothetical protein GCM10022198_12550 [Klugiella xanthotipulae]|uniref:Uncharacterized protein n=1 Tax=Klugiella xanthotipulae TaxID=244735 RepID=A0A543I424_9MICO|nr:hypothetical protein [Klugiella xanthotipulae]TQM65343.1 hypothetical protein FB466_0140 [Klugiella xanthotipulae]